MAAGRGAPRVGRWSRRAVLGLLAVAATSACDATTSTPPSPGGASGTAATPDRSPEPPAVTPDRALTLEVLLRIEATAGALATLRAARPEVRRAVTGFRRLHRTHVDLLSGLLEPPEVVAPPEAAGPDRPARAALVELETGLREDLAEAAQRAEDGALARILASASAAVAQRLAPLTRPAPEETP